MSSSPVADYYFKKNIFITGASGFLGKALLEKLLRSCDVGRIYLLLRSKRNKSSDGRLEELTKNLVFERLRNERDESIFKKLVAVSGDISEKDLGLSAADRQLLIDNVDIVFHSAATLNFSLDPRQVININLLGTRRVVKLCSEIRNLSALVYVSTAYANADRSHASEVIYPKLGNVEDLVSLVSKDMSVEEADRISQNFVKGHPNAYTITKSFAEHEICEATGIPSAIVRPSMIVGAWKEPVPGWTESKNGPPGFFMGAARGVIRRVPLKRTLVYDYIPVDTVVNELILAGWHVGTAEPKETIVFHCTTSTSKPFTWVNLEKKVNELLSQYPLQSAVWYPNLKFIPSLTLFRISSIFLHFLPALFFDLILSLSGNKPMLFKLHSRVDESLSRLSPFIFKEWFFDNTNSQKLFASLTKRDQEEFNIDIASLEYDTYFERLVLGVRRYLNNEDIKTLPAARRKHRLLFLLNCGLQLVVVLSIWWLFASVTQMSMTSAFWIAPAFYVLFCIL